MFRNLDFAPKTVNLSWLLILIFFSPWELNVDYFLTWWDFSSKNLETSENQSSQITPDFGANIGVSPKVSSMIDSYQHRGAMS